MKVVGGGVSPRKHGQATINNPSRRRLLLRGDKSDNEAARFVLLSHAGGGLTRLGKKRRSKVRKKSVSN